MHDPRLGCLKLSGETGNQFGSQNYADTSAHNQGMAIAIDSARFVLLTGLVSTQTVDFVGGDISAGARSPTLLENLANRGHFLRRSRRKIRLRVKYIDLAHSSGFSQKLGYRVTVSSIKRLQALSASIIAEYTALKDLFQNSAPPLDYF